MVTTVICPWARQANYLEKINRTEDNKKITLKTEYINPEHAYQDCPERAKQIIRLGRLDQIRAYLSDLPG